MMPALFRVSAPTRAILLALSIRSPSEPLLAVALSTDPSQRVPIADAGEMKRSIIVKGPAKSSGAVLAELPRAGAQSNENQKPKKAKRATAPPPPATVDEDDPAVKVMRNLWQQPGFQRAREEFARNAREQKQLLQDQQQEQEDPDDTRRPPMIFTTKSKTLDEVLESASAVRLLQEANSASSLSFRSSASAGPRNVRRSESSSVAAGRSPWSENPGRRTEGTGGQDEDESYSRERRILLNLQKIQNAELWNNGMPLQ